jgi:hypothetical protein
LASIGFNRDKIAKISTDGSSIDGFELENPSECTVTMLCENKRKKEKEL